MSYCIAGPHLCLKFSFPSSSEWIISIRYFFPENYNKDIIPDIESPCLPKDPEERKKIILRTDDNYFGLKIVTFVVMFTRQKEDSVCKFSIAGDDSYEFYIPGMKSNVNTMYWSGNNIEMNDAKNFVEYFINKHNLQVTNYNSNSNSNSPKESSSLRGRNNSSVSTLSLESGIESTDESLLERVNQHLEAVYNQHTISRYHMLINGGSNLFNSDIWRCCSTLHKWLLLNKNEKTKYIPSQQMKDEINNFYKSKYIRYLSNPIIKKIVSSIPAVSAFDDEDCFNNFGSYPDWIQNTPVFNYIFLASKNAFSIFFLHINSSKLSVSSNTTFVINTGKIVFANLDTRSERTINQICSNESYDKFFDSISHQVTANPETKHIVLLIASPLIIPCQYKMLQLLKSVTGPTQELIDALPNCKYLNQLFDIHESEKDYFSDSWENANHDTEKIHLIKRIFSLAQDINLRVTILSGNVELAGLTSISNSLSKTIRYNAEFIYQVISSGINSHLTKDVITKLLSGAGFQNESKLMLAQNHEWKELTSEIGDTYLAKSNWLSIQTGLTNELLLTLHVLHDDEEDYVVPDDMEKVLTSDNRYLSIPSIGVIYKKRRLRNFFRKEEISRRTKDESTS